jgi:putative ABC transport system permease protein
VTVGSRSYQEDVVEVLRRDLAFALRLLKRDPSYTTTAVLTLAICLGANAAIFTVVRSVLLRPLPYPDPSSLVFMYDSFPGAGVERAGTSVPNYIDRAAMTMTFDSVALYRTRGLDAGSAGSVERLTTQQVTPSFFDVLRATPARGTFFTEKQAQEGNSKFVVVSHAYWISRFGGRADAIGQPLHLNGEPYVILGVTPPDFVFLDPAVRLWIPSSFGPEERSEESRWSQDYEAVARLAPGVTVAQAQAQLEAHNAAIIERAGALKTVIVNAGYRSVVSRMDLDLVRHVRPALRLLWGGALFVLLIAAVNVSNLALVRTRGRLKEIATRYAIGAARARVARQVLTETILLTTVGAALGLALGAWSLGAISWIGIDDLPRGHEIHLDVSVIAFTAVLALVLGLAIGLVPAIQLTGINMHAILREDGRTATSSRGARLTRRALVVAQVALAFVLLVGAGLLLASFDRVLTVDPGFRPSHVLTGRMNPPTARYSDDAALRTFAERAVQRVRALPGVEAAGATNNLPFSDDNSSTVIIAEGYQMAPGESLVSPNQLRATPGYFEAMNIQLRRGRFFAASDTAESQPVVVIDETLARRFWPNADPIGKRMYQPQRTEDVVKPSDKTIWLHVVGVVGSVKQQGLIEGEGARVGAFYLPYAQNPSRSLGVAIRTAGDPVRMTAAARQALAEIDREMSFFDVRTMSARVEHSLDQRRTPMMLALAFAGIALLLASIGIYGVLAHQVSQRRREIGIRIALGSDARSVVGLVLREGLILVAAGLAGGLIGAVALRSVIASELYNIDALDPIVIAGVTGMLALASIVACFAPARRAARVSPLVAISDQ